MSKILNLALTGEGCREVNLTRSLNQPGTMKVMYGSTKRKFVFMEAGSSVTKDVRGQSPVLAHPAQTIGWMLEAGNNYHLKNNKPVSPST